MSAPIKKFLFSTVFVAVLFSILAMTVMPAEAHSEFVSSTPTNGEILEKSPEKVEITFSDKISVSFDAFQLLNSSSKVIDTPKAKVINGGTTLSVKIPKLEDGTYVALYSIVSADSHVVKGATSFTIGKSDLSKNQTDNQIADLLKGKKTPTYIRQSTFIAQSVILISLSLVIAAVAFQVLIVNAQFSKKQNLVVYLAAILCALATFFYVGVQAATAGNFSFSKAFTFKILADEMSSQIGKYYLLRIILCIAFAVLWKFSKYPISKVLLVVVAWGISLTPALTGHAAAGEYQRIAFIFDVTHVIAASIWFGGLILLFSFRKKDNFVEIAKQFSKIAFACVIVILITGSFALWRQSKSLEAVTGTFFGKLVLVKIAIYFLLIFIAYSTRKKMNSIAGKNDDISKKDFSKLIIIESILLIVIMIVTSVVISSVPGKTALQAGVEIQVKTKDSIFEIDVDRTNVGYNSIHVYVLNKNGTPKPVGGSINVLEESIITATWSNKDKKIEDLPIEMRYLGLNHFVSTFSNIPSAGEWTFKATIKINDITSENVETKIRFR